MTSELNPYQSPNVGGLPEAEYEISAFRGHGRKRADALREVIEQRAESGWRPVASFHFSASHYLVWRRSEWETGNARPQYRVLPLPGLIEYLKQRSFGPWPPSIAAKMARLEPGWTFAFYCSPVGYVLRSKSESEERQSAEEYTTRKHTPVWWRTLFGTSWLGTMSDQLNGVSPADGRIISYLDGNDFLVRKAQTGEQTAERRHYRLHMWPQWKNIAIPCMPHIAPWFSRQLADGWELLSHYEGAIFLFAKIR